ncbi:MAG: hypothetical protein AB7V58_03250 [Solirubrobacterales bacterium]
MTPINTRNQFYDVWNVYWPIALGVFVVILVLVVAFVLRYRSRSREVPRGKDESTPLEVGYAVGLACVAGFLVFLTFSHMPGGRDESASGPPVAIKVTAARWNWRFEYPNGAVDQGTRHHVPVLRVPVQTPLEFTGTSLDVIHSFWIPGEKFKRDLFPGKQARWQMVFERPVNAPGGGECAEFCGLEHSRMIFDVVAMPKAEFAGWLREGGS